MLAHRARQNFINASIKQNADGIARAKSKALANRARAEKLETETQNHADQVFRMSADAQLYKNIAVFNSDALFEYFATGQPLPSLSDLLHPFSPLQTLTESGFDKRFLNELIVRGARSLSNICSIIDDARYPNSQVANRFIPPAEMILQHNLQLTAQLQAFVKQQLDPMAIAIFSANLLKKLPQLSRMQIKNLLDFADGFKQLPFAKQYEFRLAELMKAPTLELKQCTPDYLFSQNLMSTFGVNINFEQVKDLDKELRQACPLANSLSQMPEFNFLYFDDQYYQKAMDGSLTSLEVAIKFESLETSSPGLLQYLSETHKTDKSLEAVYESMKAGM